VRAARYALLRDMPDERRTSRRARVPGMHVTFETAAGDRLEGEVLDIGPGGLFVRAASPIAVGKRLVLEIRFAEGAPRSALARVVWSRPQSTEGGPAGMGLALIDADESLVAVIERLVAARERTVPGAGGAKVPARERTMLGVGTTTPAAQVDEAARPIIAVAATREKTTMGVGVDSVPAVPVVPVAVAAVSAAPVVTVAETAAVADGPPVKMRAREPSGGMPPEEGWDEPAVDAMAPTALAPAMDKSIAIDLVPKKPERPAAPETPPSEASLAAAGVPRRRRGRRWLVFLVLLAAASGGLYVARQRVPAVRAFLDRVTARAATLIR